MKSLIKLSIFAAVTIVLTGLLAQTLGGFGFDGSPTYQARFTDVAGVLPGDDVRIAGVKVGRITDVRLASNQEAELEFTVSREVSLHDTTRAKIRYRNLVGQRYLALFEGPGNGLLTPGATLPVAQTAPALDLTVVFNGFRPLFTGLAPQDVNNFAFEIIKLLQGEGGTVKSLLQHVGELTGTLADRDELIGRVIANLHTVLGALDRRDVQLDETIKQMQLLVSGLAADRKALGSALTGIGGLAEATSSLLHDARPALQADIAALDKLTKTLVDNTAVIESTLANAPARLDALTRTASYGSWFNFFLCDFDGTVTMGNQRTSVPAFHASDARCAR